MTCTLKLNGSDCPSLCSSLTGLTDPLVYPHRTHPVSTFCVWSDLECMSGRTAVVTEEWWSRGRPVGVGCNQIDVDRFLPPPIVCCFLGLESETSSSVIWRRAPCCLVAAPLCSWPPLRCRGRLGNGWFFRGRRTCCILDSGPRAGKRRCPSKLTGGIWPRTRVVPLSVAGRNTGPGVWRRRRGNRRGRWRKTDYGV